MSYHPAPKWFAVINDTSIPVPQRVVKVQVLKFQASVPDEQVLLRDFNTPQDIVLDNHGVVDLAEGNVFYSRHPDELKPNATCPAVSAKRAFSVNDAFEVTLVNHQTRESLLDLFGVGRDVQLLRDYESPQDQVIEAGTLVLFEEGPVLVTRGHSRIIHYTVDTEPQETAEKKLTSTEIMREAGVDAGKHYLIFLKPDGGEISYKDNPHAEINMHEGMQFVTASLCPTPVS